MKKKERSEAQLAADDRYETKRASQQKRFGGRCSEEEKEFLLLLSKERGLNEKDLIFKALHFFDENAPKET